MKQTIWLLQAAGAVLACIVLGIVVLTLLHGCGGGGEDPQIPEYQYPAVSPEYPVH